ncbi:MBL fold metallo-hydrolase [Siminovitchia sp. FSL H7-0308]|uniref:MBL fold metallo-hydrolase n=1 Tax=Siminovitchia sp. FSL H7-0308 TaxID=2921432 RepID=UPI0030EE0F34
MQIRAIEEKIYRIAVPIPFPMKYVYCYLFQEEDGWSIVDTGFNYPEATEVWKKVFSELSIKPSSLQAIYVTHYHPDHSGLAGWMQKWSGAPVYISVKDGETFDLAFSDKKVMAARFGEICKENGVPEELMFDIQDQFEKMGEHVRPFPEFTFFEKDEIILGGDRWQVIHTPGHSDGMFCFYQQEKQLLLAADHVLARITPNIGLWPYGRENPLQDYLQSLEEISSLDVRCALPGHGDLILDLPKRINEIHLHHEQRLNEMYNLVIGGKTAFEVSREVFKERQLNSHQWRFAIAETLAHLEYLYFSGKITKSKSAGSNTTVYTADSYIEAGT